MEVVEFSFKVVEFFQNRIFGIRISQASLEYVRIITVEIYV